MLTKLKSALKNHKKVVDKNVPLNRLGLKSQEWLIEPDLEGLTDNFKPLHLSKNKGWRGFLSACASALVDFIKPFPPFNFTGAKNLRGVPAFLKEKANVYKLKYFLSKE